MMYREMSSSELLIKQNPVRMKATMRNAMKDLEMLVQRSLLIA